MKNKNMSKITRSQLNQLISEEVQRLKKIKELNEKKESIKKELSILNEFTVVSPGDKESLKSLTQHGRQYLNSLNTLTKKYPESKLPKLLQKFVMLHKEAEGVLADMALNGESKPDTPGQVPAMPSATVTTVPVASATSPATPATMAVAAEEELSENGSLSLSNKQGQNLKPNVAHVKKRTGVK